MEGQVGEKGQVIAGLWGSSEGLSLGGVGGKRGWGINQEVFITGSENLLAK